MKIKCFYLKINISIFCVLSFSIGYAQKNDSLKNEYVYAKSIRGQLCRHVHNWSLDSIDQSFQLKDKRILSFFDSILILKKAPKFDEELFNCFRNLDDRTQSCVYPLMYLFDSLFVCKAKVFAQPASWNFRLSDIYFDPYNVKLSFLFYLEQLYYKKTKIGDNLLISDIKLIKRNKKIVDISEYNRIINLYAKEILSNKIKFRSPLRKLKVKWEIKSFNIFPTWRESKDRCPSPQR
ncbi:MAG: hypothetical protein KA319_12715 [Ferruginibacter sp.]|nr:hypothetical protein [Ferruginibacter sp.]